MSGYVRQKSNGLWYAYVYISPDPDTGKRRSRGLGEGHRSRRAANASLIDANARGKHGWSGPDRATFAEYLREWIDAAEVRLEPSTVALYRTLIESSVIPWLGGERLQDVTPEKLSRLYVELLRHGSRSGAPLAPKSVRNVHTTIRRALEDATARGRIDRNPAALADVPKTRTVRERGAWTADEVARFFAEVADDRLAPVWVLAATTGLRRGELAGLRWRDVDLDSGELRVANTRVPAGAAVIDKAPKTRRGARSVPLAAEAVTALRRWQTTQKREALAFGPRGWNVGGYVFTDEAGEPYKPMRLTRSFERAASRTDLPRITLHGLRHTFATINLDAGVDTVYVSELIGHASPGFTGGTYQHTRRDRLAGAVDAVADAIFGE